MSHLQIHTHQIAYEKLSDGEDALFFIHGWSSSPFFWQPTLPFFTGLGSCFTIALPGHYPSRFPENLSQFTQNDLLEIVSDCIRILGNGKKVTLIGHSAGGLVALGIAGLKPELVNRVVAICPASHGPIQSGGLYPLKLAMNFGFAPIMNTIHRGLFFVPRSMDLFFSMAVYDKPKFFGNSKNQEFLEKYKEVFKNLDPNVMWIYLDLLDKCDIRPLAREIKAPTFFVLGDHDEMVPRTHGVRLSKLVPNSDSVVLDCGHLPTLELPEITISHILNWLNLHPV